MRVGLELDDAKFRAKHLIVSFSKFNKKHSNSKKTE